jgi:hypothetical protein
MGDQEVEESFMRNLRDEDTSPYLSRDGEASIPSKTPIRNLVRARDVIHR